MMERKRYICQECKNCEDNYRTLSYCCTICGYPMDILIEHEKIQKEKEDQERRFIEYCEQCDSDDYDFMNNMR